MDGSWFGFVVLVILASACAGAAPTDAGATPTDAEKPVRVQERHPCDEKTDARVNSRREPDGFVLERHETTGYCSTLRTEVHTLGRIVAPAEGRSDCPVGSRVFRSWDNSLQADLPSFERALDPIQNAELRSGIRGFGGYGSAEAYLLGCPKPGHADYVFVNQTGSVMLFVKNRLVPEDPRFKRPAPY